MKQVDHLESAQSVIGAPLDAIVELANEAGATAIVADAERAAERLDQLRLFVVVLGGPDLDRAVLCRIVGDTGFGFDTSHPTSFRFARFPHARVAFHDGSELVMPIAACERLSPANIAAVDLFVDSPLLRSGICLNVGPIRPYARMDVVLTSKDGCDRVGAAGKTFVIDGSRMGDIDQAIASIHETAIESGAAAVEVHAAAHQRQLCVRLGHHLSEHQRALVRSRSAMLARINALTVARTLADCVLEARSRRPNTARDELMSWLCVERTKFLMSTKADALMELDERLALADPPRHLFRRAAAETTRAISVELLGQLWQRTSEHVEQAFAALSKSLLVDLDVPLREFGENVSPQTFTGFELVPIRGLRRDVEWPVASGITQIVDRMGLANRGRIQSAAHEDLVSALTTGSQGVIDCLLASYDEASRAIERRFCELLDAAVQSVQMAAELAYTAQLGGTDSLAQARGRIGEWKRALDDIVTRLT